MFSSVKPFFRRLLSRIKLKISSKSLRSAEHDLLVLRKANNRFFPRIKQILHLKKILSKKEVLIINLSLVILLIGVVWFSFEFVGKHRVQVPAVGGRYIEAVVGSPQAINPLFANTNDVDMDITKLVYSGLMRYDEQHRLIPDLAAKYEVSEDKKIYTFELKKDVVWHDGEPLTSRDVLFTIESIQNDLVGSPLFFSFQGVQMEALDDYTISFILEDSFSPFLSTLTVGMLPEHIWFDVLPENFRLAQFNIQPIGTGPFMFKKLSKDESGFIYQYELMRFERYYRELAYLEEFVFQFYPDYEGETGAVQAVRSQKVNGLSFVPKNLRDKVERKHVKLNVLQLPQYTALFFNKDKQPFLKSIELRKALTHSVDKDRILKEVLNNEGQIIYSPILPGFPGYDSEVEKLSFSYSEANKLLDDEKWTRISAEDYRTNLKEERIKKWEEENKDILNPPPPSTEESETESDTENNNEENVEENVDEVAVEESAEVSTTTLREQAEADIEKQLDEELSEAQIFYRKDKDDEVLEIRLVTVDTDEYKKAAELIAGFWQNIGVKTNLEFVEARDMSRQVLKTRDYDILLYGEIVGNDPDPYPFWHSSQIDYPGLNLSRYINRNVDDLIETARESTDDSIVLESYKKFQDIILKERPAVFLYMPTYTYATSDEVKGIDVERISHPSDRFVDVSSWYMKTEGDWKWKTAE